MKAGILTVINASDECRQSAAVSDRSFYAESPLLLCRKKEIFEDDFVSDIGVTSNIGDKKNR